MNSETRCGGSQTFRNVKCKKKERKKGKLLETNRNVIKSGHGVLNW